MVMVTTTTTTTTTNTVDNRWAYAGTHISTQVV